MRKERRLTGRSALAAVTLAALALGAGAAGGASADFDRTFSDNGRVTLDSGFDEAVYDIAVQPDGKIVAAGWTGSGENALVYRLRANGTLDRRFGGDGIVPIETSAEEWVEAVVVQPDGKIVVAGRTSNGSNAIVYRLRPSGKLDPTFGGDGGVELDSGGYEAAYDVALQPDGKIVVAGYTTVDDNAVVYRLKRNGDLDPTFDGDGAVGIDSDGIETAYAVALQPGGKIVVAGRMSVGNDAAVHRLRPNGSLDPTFGDDGTVAIDVGGVEYARAVGIQANGRILLSGYTSTTDSAVAFRLNRSGARDPSFDDDGIRRLAVDGFEEAYALALQPDGRMIFAGWAYNGKYDSLIVRLQGDPVPTCGGRYATQVGTRRGDRLTGTSGADVIAGLGGRDVIRGLAGNDVLCGGKGNDRLYGGPGRDRLYGGPGIDRLFGGPGKDAITH